MKPKSIIRAISLLALAGVGLMAPAFAGQAVELIAGPATGIAADAPPAAAGWTKREALVTLNPTALALVAADAPAGGGGNPSLRVSLFPDAVFTLEGTSSDRKWDATEVTEFGIAGDSEGSAVIAVTGGVLNATVATGDHHVYRIQPAGGDLYRVEELDHGKFPDCPISNANEVDAGPAAAGDAPPTASADSGTLIKVLVAYTQAAETAAGGPAAIANVIAVAESETNTGYTTSGVNFQIDIVHTVKVDYDEATADPFGDALDAITDGADGKMDEVHGLRNTYHADLVGLVINNTQYCGLGWLPGTVSSANAAYGFSVSHWGCDNGYYSFAHEMGHNMGVRHDPFMDAVNTPYAYGHGHVNTTAKIRSIMAYNNACSGVGGCTRVNHWSAADRLYNGTDTIGDATTSKNNVALNNSASAIADYRIDPHSVTTSVTGGGTIDPTSAVVEHGATTSFTVTPNSGYDIQSVTGCGGSLSGSTYTTGAANADCIVSATFQLRSYTVSTSAGAGGGISPSSATVNHGSTTSFTVTPNSGYSIQSVSGCGGSRNGNTYTTGAITGACTVTASFTTSPDSDGDGLTDDQELKLGTDLNTPNTVVSGSGAAVGGSGSSEVILTTRTNTSVNAGGGNDVIASALGRQVITLGAGADVVVWSYYPDSDVINDFNAAEGDRLDVRNLLAGFAVGYAGGDPVGTFVICSATTGGVYVKFDRDGAGINSAVNYALVKGMAAPGNVCPAVFIY